jgi:hypothetical protein
MMVSRRAGDEIEIAIVLGVDHVRMESSKRRSFQFHPPIETIHR